MSEENVERFHLLTRMWNEHHRIGAEHLAEDVEWLNPDDAVEPGRHLGPDAFNEAIRSIFEGWDDSRFEPERVMGRGDDVIALGVLRTHGRAGLELTRPHGQVWTFQGGRVTRFRWYQSHADALADVGLSE